MKVFRGRRSASSLFCFSLAIAITACSTYHASAYHPALSRAPGTQLDNGEEVVSAISVGETATFEFNVQTAGTVRVSVGEDINFAAEPVLEVFDSEDVLVASASTSSGSDVFVQFSTLETGTFRIDVSDNGDNEAMDFRIRAISLPGQPILIGGRDQTLQNGEQINSEFPLGSFAIFPFEVDSPGTIRISLGETNGSPGEPVAQLFNPSGVLLGEDQGNDHAFIEVVSFQTGTYYVVVSDGANDEALEFQMRMFSLPGTPQMISGRDQALDNGEEFFSDFPLGSFNVFPFEVESPGTVIVGVGETGAGLPANPFLRVFSPSGQQVATDESNSDAFVIFQTFETGTFTIVVAEGQTNDPMEFRVRALRLPGNPMLLSMDSPLQNGVSQESAVEIGGFAIFPFFLDEPGLVTVNVGESGAGLLAEPNLRVYDPTGVLVDSDTGSNDATVQFTSFLPGVYTAVVTDNFTDEVLEFNIVATGISDGLPVVLGDVNGDGEVDLLDVAPFVERVSTGQFQIEADINQDGVVDLLDVAPFVELLIG